MDKLLISSIKMDLYAERPFLDHTARNNNDAEDSETGRPSLERFLTMY